MKKLYLTLGLLMCITSQTYAGDYAIQLSASKAPQLSTFMHLEKFGSLYTTITDNDLIRTRLGPFYGKEPALKALADVQAAGYPNAFLVNADTGNDMTVNATSSTGDLQGSSDWQMLSAEQQANVVTLDGALHIKEGDNFIPLSEAIK